MSLEPPLLRARVPGPLSCVPSTGPRLFRAPAVPGSSHRSPQARPPALLTGDWSSRCRGSRRPAPGNRAAARLLPGRDRGSRWPEPTRTSSSKPMVIAKPASFCTARPRGPGVPGAGDNQERPRRLDRSCGPRLERREPAGGGVKSGSEVEVVWGGRPRLSRAAFSNSARWALRSQRGRGSFFLTLRGPGLRRRLPSWGCPERCMLLNTKSYILNTHFALSIPR